MLSLLMVILAFNYVDRLALGLVLQDLKMDLDLSDTQLGLLSGLAFAVFYSLMGIPIARWADRGNRVIIIALTTGLWSLAVACCGLAGNFVQLLIIRIGVAVGEAGCIPPAHSLIADHTTRAERPRAVAYYMLGAPLAMIVGNFAAGWLNEAYGWRVTFIALGLPGLVLAVLAALTLHEPRRKLKPHALQRSEFDSAPRVSLLQTLVYLWTVKSLRHLLFCFSVVSFFGYGLLQWQPAFFMRSFGLGAAELGMWFALILGGGGLVGVWLGGHWASRHAAHDERLQLKVIALLYASFGLVSIAMYLSSSAPLAFALMAIATIGVYAISGPLFGAIQSLSPTHMRATAIAVLYLFANLIGMGLGPLAAGALSDALAATYGAESLRYSLLLLSPGYGWAAWHVWRASKSVMVDMQYAEQVDHAAAPAQ